MKMYYMHALISTVKYLTLLMVDCLDINAFIPIQESSKSYQKTPLTFKIVSLPNVMLCGAANWFCTLDVSISHCTSKYEYIHHHLCWSKQHRRAHTGRFPVIVYINGSTRLESHHAHISILEYPLFCTRTNKKLRTLLKMCMRNT